MKHHYMVIDVAICHDCNNCFIACKDEHYMNNWLPWAVSQPRHGHRWMNIERLERGQYPRIDVCYRPTPCMHCGDAPCIKDGGGAIYRREDGIVIIDPEKAKNNKKLVETCPYGAIYWNEDEKVAQKCTFCAHLMDDETWKPGIPRCVHTCPTGALSFYTLEPAEMEKKIANEKLEVLKPELDTKPHVFYKNLYRFNKSFISAEIIRNDDCVENATVVLKNKDGKELARQLTNFFGEFKFDALDNGTYTIEVSLADGSKVSKTVTIAENQSVNAGFINI
jgi:Fe-S-cluster-containing dehydrogenase component